MKFNKLIMLSVLVTISFLLSCSEDETITDPPQVFNVDYNGFLKLTFTNEFPSFDETTQVDVHIDKYGNVTMGTGTLSYNADENNGQSRIVRVGTLSLNPNGNHFVSNNINYLGVDENTTIAENMIVYYWDETTQAWVEFVNENINSTWNGGLAFNIDDAVWSGSVIQSVTAWGSVTWGLYLVLVP